MDFTLYSISPIDGRYHSLTKELSAYFSEIALMRFRVYIEIEYFIALCELPLPHLKLFDKSNFSALRSLHKDFSEADARKIKRIEASINHDVKAIEYFIKERFDGIGLAPFKEFVHFGLTSQDINNTAIPSSWKLALHHVYFPALNQVIDLLNQLAETWKDVPMLARTHGQPASPTRMGKELLVFAERLKIQTNLAKEIPFSAKFGGATGNFNAHVVSYPEIDWKKFANQFVNDRLMLCRSETTTQIEHYDNFAAHCDALKRINTILIDLNRDLWTYISLNYFNQKTDEKEVGSSAMPHKVNPIDFENSEGNLGVANALFEHFAANLPQSRLQRDLTDSTVLRNIGVPLAHTLIGIKSTLKGIHKLSLNQYVLQKDLNANWGVVAEALQTILRREGYQNPYETLKQLTRNKDSINAESIVQFINSLPIAEHIKEEMRKINPMNYTGV